MSKAGKCPFKTQALLTESGGERDKEAVSISAASQGVVCPEKSGTYKGGSDAKHTGCVVLAFPSIWSTGCSLCPTAWWRCVCVGVCVSSPVFLFLSLSKCLSTPSKLSLTLLIPPPPPPMTPKVSWTQMWPLYPPACPNTHNLLLFCPLCFNCLFVSFCLLSSDSCSNSEVRQHFWFKMCIKS